MEFETRMRKLIKDLVQPIVDRGAEDRAMLTKLDYQKLDHNERLDTIEQALFKSKHAKSLFEEMDSKIAQMERELRSDSDKVMFSV